MSTASSDRSSSSSLRSLKSQGLYHFVLYRAGVETVYPAQLALPPYACLAEAVRSAMFQPDEYMIHAETIPTLIATSSSGPDAVESSRTESTEGNQLPVKCTGDSILEAFQSMCVQAIDVFGSDTAWFNYAERTRESLATLLKSQCPGVAAVVP